MRIATQPSHAHALSRLLGVLAAVLTVAGCAATPPTSARHDSLPATAADYAGAPRVVAIALKYVGAPYARGGAAPSGFDCSGFVMYVYGRAGVPLPHGVAKQYRLGSPVSRGELDPGDIVFFDRLRHNGIYIGEGKFVHATKPGDVVKISRLDDEWFRRRWVGARRLR